MTSSRLLLLALTPFLGNFFLPFGLIKNGCLASAARQAEGETSGSSGQLSHRCAAPDVHRLALWSGQLSIAGECLTGV